MRFPRIHLLRFCLFAGFCLRGMNVTDYAPEANDRFASGYPSAPVPNLSPNFAGAGLDWSIVGWAANTPTKSFGFVSPRHYLAARHFGGSSSVRIFGADGQLHTRNQLDVRATGLGVIFQNQTVGDLSLGTLTEAFPASAMPYRPGVLDLNNSSTQNTPGNYTALPLLIYGRAPAASPGSPRVAGTPMQQVSISGDQHLNTTSRVDLALEDGDSGGPGFAVWTHPLGHPELAILMNHAAINTETNFHNFLGSREVMSTLGDLMRREGRALRVVAPPFAIWSGGTSQLNRNGNWGLSRPNSTGAMADRFVLFDGAATSTHALDVNANLLLRGLYFRNAPGFSFSGTRTLSVGRGGIANYSSSPQQFNAALQLTAHQLWKPGPGGLQVQNLNTDSFLLEILGPGETTITHSITGAGDLALDGGTLRLQGTSPFTGKLWVHDGTLELTGNLSSAAEIDLNESALLTGNGDAPLLRGGGRVRPADGVLDAEALDPAQGIRLELSLDPAGILAAPLLRLRAADPLLSPLSAAHPVRIQVDPAALQEGAVLQGGWFFDTPPDPARLAEAAYSFVDSSGTEITTPLDLWVTHAPATVDFGQGSVSGVVLTLQVLPPAGTYANWTARHFPPDTDPELQEPFAAPNPLGWINLLTYALQTDPLAPDPAARPAAFVNNGEWVFQFRRNPQAEDLDFLVEFTPALDEPWEISTVQPARLPEPDPDGAERWEVRQPTQSLPSPLFYRLRVVLQNL